MCLFLLGVNEKTCFFPSPMLHPRISFSCKCNQMPFYMWTYLYWPNIFSYFVPFFLFFVLFTYLILFFFFFFFSFIFLFLFFFFFFLFCCPFPAVLSILLQQYCQVPRLSKTHDLASLSNLQASIFAAALYHAPGFYVVTVCNF